jgi:hypothetical protein
MEPAKKSPYQQTKKGEYRHLAIKIDNSLHKISTGKLELPQCHTEQGKIGNI